MTSSLGSNPREAAFEAARANKSGDTSDTKRSGNSLSPMSPSNPTTQLKAGQKGSSYSSGRSGRTWHPVRIALMVVGSLALFGIGLFGFQIKEISGKVFANSKKASFFSQLSQVVTSKAVVLKGSERDRINILLLGMGGEGHDGPNLTDTIMMASIKPSTEQVALISLPRDLYVPIPGYGHSKINAAHAFAEDAAGNGPEVAEQTIGNVLAQPIDYYFRIDFEGFRQAIDNLGGIDVNVPHGFYDFNKNVTFTAGLEHMNGERALAYSRARYVEGSEGSDFARAARQQIVMKAVRDNVLSTNSIGDVINVAKALESLGSHIKTDLGPGELLAIYKLTKDLDTADVINFVVDGQKTGLVYGDSIPMGGINASVLIPTAGMDNFSQIQSRTSSIFDTDLLSSENATVEVQNGSTTVGIGRTASDEIPMTVLAITNAANKDYTKTVIIDYSGGAYPHAKTYLEGKFGVDVVSSTDANVPRQTQADFVVIVGSDYATEISK